jgi:hypothetical protein
VGTKIKIVVGIVVVVVLVVVGVSLLTGGDDDKPKSARDKAAQSDKKPPSKSDDTKSSSEPALHTVGSKRAVGSNVATNVGALMRSPKSIYLRVSAAPKQEVTVNWTLACGVGATVQGSYDATPPDTRELPLPKKRKTCVASAGSQVKGKKGRLKLAILTGG